MPAQPPLVFIIYAREDERFRADLKKQLLPMERSGQLRVWTDRELIAGEHWEPAIKKQLQNADLILMLISSDYFASDYIHAVELREAIERHERGEARVVPVIVRDCAWEADAVVNCLQVLPTDGVPVDDTRHWHSRDAAWADVVRGVGRTLQQLLDERAAAEASRLAAEKADTARLAAEEQRAREAEAASRREIQTRAEAEARDRTAREAETARRLADENAWQQARHAGTPEAYRAYLNVYPSGAHAREARQQIKQLQQNDRRSTVLRNVATAFGVVLLSVLGYVLQPSPNDTPTKAETNASIAAETSAWEVAKQAKTVRAYQTYLSDNSNGAHATEAQKALDNLQAKIRSLLSDALNTVEDAEMRQNCLNNLQAAHLLDPDNVRITEIHDMLKDEGMIPDAKRALKGLLGK